MKVEKESKFQLFLFGLMGLIIVLGLALVATFYIVNSPKFWKESLPPYINQKYDNIKISSVDFDELNVKWSGDVNARNIKLTVFLDDLEMKVVAKSLSLGSLLDYWNTQKTVQLKISGLNIDSLDKSLEDAEIDLKIDRAQSDRVDYAGTITASEMNLDSYQWINVNSKVSGNPQQLLLSDFDAEFYGGDMRGVVSLMFEDDLPFEVNMKLRRVNFAYLKDSMPAIGANVDAYMEGNIDVKGKKGAISDLNSSFQTTAGGNINAEVFQYFVSYIPIDEQKKKLQELINVGGQVPVEEASLELESLQEDQLTMIIMLKSKEFNLDLNLTIDVNVDGGLINLFKQLEKIS